MLGNPQSGIRLLRPASRPQLYGALVAGVLLSAAAPAVRAADYYVDSRRGVDGNSGSKEQPWRSLERLRHVVFQPGDTLFFVAGSRFDGGFEVKQSGTA